MKAIRSTLAVCVCASLAVAPAIARASSPLAVPAAAPSATQAMSPAVASALSPSATPAAPPAALMPGWTQHLGAALPAGLPLRDADGRAVRLGDYFGPGPVALVLGYYRCRNVCVAAFDSALQALALSGARGYRFVGVSIDPDDGPSSAAPRQRGYRAQSGGTRIDLLTGAAAPLQTLAGAIGFGYRYDAATSGYQHALGMVILTPDGHVSQYLPGLRYPAPALNAALARADGGDRGTLADAVLLACGGGPAGVHSGLALTAVRLTAAGALAGLAAMLLRTRRRRA